MELPDLPLALVREFSRPRVSKEARDEYAKAIQQGFRLIQLDHQSRLKRAMVMPHAVEIVRRYNETMDAIDAICREPGPTWRTDLTKCYEDRDFWRMEIRKLVYG